MSSSLYSLMQFKNQQWHWIMNQDIPFDKDKFTSSVPHSPGVYRILNDRNQVIYVGKAKLLQNRINVYLEGKSHRQDLEPLIKNIQTVFVFSDEEAIQLEYYIYKKYYLPYFNKTTPEKSKYLVIENNEYPSLTETPLRVEDLKKLDWLHIFGPIVDGRLAQEINDELRDTFKLPRCKDTKFKRHQKLQDTCEYYDDFKNCNGYCLYGNKEQYQQTLTNLVNFLHKKKHNLDKDLLKKLTLTKKHLPFTSILDSLDYNSYYDLLYLVKNEQGVAISVIEVYAGSVLEIRNFCLSSSKENLAKGNTISFNEQVKYTSEIELWESFILQYYALIQDNKYKKYQPKQIYFISEQAELLDMTFYSQELSTLFAYKIKASNKCKHKGVIKLAKYNAKLALEQRTNLQQIYKNK